MIEKLIIKEISKNINLYDKDIALILKKKYPKYFSSFRLDTLRRRIGYTREETNLNKPVLYDREQYLKDITEHLERYKEDSRMGIARRLKIKYPNLKLRTIEHKLYEKTHYA